MPDDSTTKRCEQCDKPIQGGRPDKRFCNDRCRMDHHLDKRRRGAELLEQQQGGGSNAQ